jgi:hypothetical protein
MAATLQGGSADFVLSRCVVALGPVVARARVWIAKQTRSSLYLSSGVESPTKRSAEHSYLVLLRRQKSPFESGLLSLFSLLFFFSAQVASFCRIQEAFEGTAARKKQNPLKQLRILHSQCP